MILLQIIVSSAVLLFALFLVGTTGWILIFQLAHLVSASRPLSSMVKHDGFYRIILFCAGIPFVIIASRTLYHTLRYRSGKATAIPANNAMRSLLKAIIVIPVVAIVAAGVWLVIDMFFISGFPGV